MNQQKNDLVIKALHQGLALIFNNTDTGAVLVDKQGTTSPEYRLEEIIRCNDLKSLFKPEASIEDKQSELLAVNNELDTTELVIYTDGGSRGNPGPSASGYVIMDSDENILEEGGEYLGITTNNQAEYQAVKIALEAAAKFNPKIIRFKIDSLLVVNQMIGKYKIKNRDLWPIHAAIKTLVNENYDDVTFTHVRREFNKLADQKVNEVLDARMR